MTAEESKALRSRLPEDQGYWDALARRVVAVNDPLLRDYRQRQEAWWSPIARLSPALAAAALILLAGYFVVGAAEGSPGAMSPLEAAVVPEDDMARTVLTSTAGPPTIETLLGVVTPTGEGP